MLEYDWIDVPEGNNANKTIFMLVYYLQLLLLSCKQSAMVIMV